MKQIVGDTASGSPAAAPALRPHVTMARGKRAMLGLGWSALNTGSAVLISILVFVVTSRLMGPEEFGIVALAISIIALIGCLTPGGFGEAIIQRAEINDAHLDTVFWICMGTGLAVFVPTVVFAGAMADWIGEPILALLLPFLAVKILIDLAAVVPQALVIRAMQFKYVAARTAIGNSVGGVVCVAMALQGYGLWALAAAPVITSVVSLVILARSARWRPGFQVRLSALRDLLRFGLYASGANALYLLNADRLVLGLVAGPATLGLYYLGRKLYDLLSSLISGALWPVTTVFFASTQKETGTHVRAFRNVLRGAAIITFPVFGGLYAVADSAVPMLLGSHWEPALPAVKAFAILGIFSGLMLPAAALANGLGRSDLNFTLDTIRNLLAVGAILLAVQAGLQAIMTMLIVAHALVLPASFLVARKLTGIRLTTYAEALSVPLLSAVVMLAAINAVPWMLPAATAWTLLFLQIGFGAVVYIILTLGLSGREITELRKTFAKEAAHD